MNAVKKFRPMSLLMTGLAILLLFCSLLLLPAGSGSKLFAAQPGGASQAGDAAPIDDSRFSEEMNGSSLQRILPPSVRQRKQGATGATAAEPLTCSGSPVAFEGGLPSDWSSVVWTGTVHWSTTSDLSACNNGGNLTPGSGQAACADADETNAAAIPYDAELFSNSFNLSGQDEVKLQFAAAYNDIGTVDLFEVWVWDSGVGSLALQWNEDHNEIKEIDLSSYKGKTDVAVSFRYYGTGWDWYAQVDDVQLNCTAFAPDIFVDPLFMGSTQYSGSVTNHPLDISNVGTVNLDWAISEDSYPVADVCDTPVDLPWASVAPNSGTTAPGGTDSVTVTFDASGMVPGTYNGVLCVDSNDPDPGPGNGTDRVLVELEMTVEAPPPPDHDDFATPRAINPLPYVNIVDTAGATNAGDDPVMPCVSRQGTYTVWYHFSTMVPGTLTVTTNDSSYDTVLAIWTGNRGSLVNIACDDDGGNGYQSLIVQPAADHVDYYVEVAGYSSSTLGTLKLAAQFVQDVPSFSAPGRAGQSGTVIGQGTADTSMLRQQRDIWPGALNKQAKCEACSGEGCALCPARRPK